MDPPPRVDPDTPEGAEVVAGRYRLDRSLGASRMAEVFATTDLLLRRPVAVKRLPSSALRDATAKARFAREARALARVNDPSVVMVFDFVVDEGRPFLVMELVDGTTLRHLLDRERRLEPARVVAITAGICSGLRAVHARGIVHRDLKPSNVFLTPSGAVKIGDFGIASVANDVTVTSTGEVFGSAPYVAPEQVTGDPIDARTDLYALGCVMFEMATGRPPFQGGDATALAYRHVHEAPERADRVAPEVPEALASAIEGLMAKDPADRPTSAEEVQRTLEAMPVAAAGPIPASDALTQPIEPPRATDVLPAVPPPLPPGPPRRPSPLLPWVGALVIGVVVLLALNALAGGRDGARAASPSGPSSPSSASPPSSPRSPSPTPTEGPTAQDPTAALLALVDELGSSGVVDQHLANDLQHGVDEVLRALDDGDGEELLRALDHLQEKVEKGIEKGEIAPEDASRLDEAIRTLAATVDEDQGDAD